MVIILDIFVIIVIALDYTHPIPVLYSTTISSLFNKSPFLGYRFFTSSKIKYTEILIAKLIDGPLEVHALRLSLFGGRCDDDEEIFHPEVQFLVDVSCYRMCLEKYNLLCEKA